VRPSTFLASIVLCSWLAPAINAAEAGLALQIGTPVVVVTGEFPPTQMSAADSGYSKPFVIHPGKRAVVVGLDAARQDLAIVKWDEQYWQEWSDPPVENYLDSSRYFMNQGGKWLKWKSFTSTINISNLRPTLAAARKTARE